ncbi:hypothetical protein SAMIE_1032080 [Sphingobium amiense]|uniref:O-antigen ligase-related domain-containing protein n=1 Tax=Sphingobium amiense TaxID=135719 RepID=A0A494WAK7_9SPHN|nr:O-antigen ligase family protein [Sphingobium amiense]BBD99707.1 hypothetical protein SAMIE_1032080 [Sphingobium amiense]
MAEAEYRAQLPVLVSRRRIPPAVRQAAPLLSALAMTIGLAFNGLNDAAGETVAAMLGAGLLAALLIDARPDAYFWRQRKPVLIPALLAGLWLSLGAGGIGLSPAIPMPYAPDFAGPALMAWFGGLAALIGGSIIGADRVRMERTIRLVLLCIGATLFIGMLMWVAGPGTSALDYWSVSRRGRFAGMVSNVNVTAALAGGAILQATALAILARRRARERKDGLHNLSLALAVSVMAIASIALLLTAARFPIVVTVALLISLAALLRRRRRRRSRAIAPSWVWPLLGLLVAALLWWLSGPLLARFDTLGSEALVRSMMWDHYFDLAAASPLQGYGPGSFPTLNAATLDDPLTAGSLWFVNSAHSLFLQIALAGGFPYLFLMVWAGWAILYPVARLAWRGSLPMDTLGTFALVVAILLCATVDIALDVPAVVLLTLFLAGLLWGRALKLREHGVASA